MLGKRTSGAYVETTIILYWEFIATKLKKKLNKKNENIITLLNKNK